MKVKPRELFAIQDEHIKKRFDGFASLPGRDHMERVWIGELCPHADGTWYEIEIRYTIGYPPKVWVRSPQLREDAPHRWSDGSLCLYTPGEWEWHPALTIAETILPWAAVWLYYYELWVDTGKWHAPETPHGPEGKVMP